jgi:glycosyltransferase involved in cell wall biosynthesis
MRETDPPAVGMTSDEGSESSANMKILVVSFRFPPYNAVGGVSVGKTVKYLVALGHDVRVVTARDQQVPTTLSMEVDAHAVMATGWLNPMRVAEVVAGGRDHVAATGFSAGRKHERLVYRIGRLYRSLIIPDQQIGWGWSAFRAGCRLARTWRPDVIYGSAPPYTGLLAASGIASRTGIPWVAGLRDLWSDNPYRRIQLARLDRALEFRVLSSAAGIVVTTEEAEDVIRARFRVPTATVMNGYDPDDACERSLESSPEELRVVYTGVLNHDRRDPTLLFHAMRTLRAEGRTVVADFYGRDSVLAAKAGARVGVGDLVSVHGAIPYGDSLQVQRDADLLLLLQWNNPAERGVCPAKIFEYAAARRPVLGIGPDDGVVARLLGEFGMGVVLQRPDDIAGELRRLMDEKARAGGLPDVASQPPDELSRERQVEKLARFLACVARSPRSGVRPGRPMHTTRSSKGTRYRDDPSAKG